MCCEVLASVDNQPTDAKDNVCTLRMCRTWSCVSYDISHSLRIKSLLEMVGNLKLNPFCTQPAVLFIVLVAACSRDQLIQGTPFQYLQKCIALLVAMLYDTCTGIDAGHFE